jgi:hypothetical protein
VELAEVSAGFIFDFSGINSFLISYSFTWCIVIQYRAFCICSGGGKLLIF